MHTTSYSSEFVSGTGEYIIRAMLAQRLGEAFEKGAGNSDGDDPHEVLHGVLNDQFCSMPPNFLIHANDIEAMSQKCAEDVGNQTQA